MTVQRTRIKMCGFTREADVQAAALAGADAVGFVLYPPSPRHVSIERAAELAQLLPAFVSPVLLFVNDSAERIRQACAAVPGAVLQFHGDETPEFCEAMSQATGRPHLKAARIPLTEAARFDLVKFAEIHQKAQAILLDAHVDGYGGGGKTFNWSLLPPSVNAHLVLSGGLTPANVADGIRALRPRARSLAVDVSSGIEAGKGLKDADQIRQFVLAVRAADNAS
ncbi:phosphoribosylanthranilate isomerase [Limnohabitans lacus]|jgi:phosphoribosylanthranilate isomerase|uniref:N-(5'-phosphoribosyl)anthranilate isomerase n=1 Tax=Limnohabitans lacus TaxID=3045173 RepID=A0ABT6X283_9BURK|nr:phosphoribosylanthranilate isomerase [Limnohabitans sp. HM2-2]MDI9232227.1 phosphoribosylanthranilate isomerase [Limnohabitans sp. HM2-2]